MRYIVIQNSDNLIMNAIMWDGVSEWTPPEDTFVVQNDVLEIGETYIP